MSVDDTLGSDRLSATLLIRDARGRRMVAREFVGLAPARRAHLRFVFEQQKRLRIPGLVVPEALVSSEDRLLWLHRPIEGTGLNRTEFSAEQAADLLLRLGVIVGQLHARSLFGLELRSERVIVTAAFEPVITGLLASPTLWEAVEGTGSLSLQDLDPRVDLVAFAAIVTQVAERARTRSAGDQKVRAELLEIGRDLATTRPSLARALQHLARLAGSRLTATLSLPGPPVPGIAGRDALLRELVASVERGVRDGDGARSPALLALVGRAGAGKSRVVSALARVVLASGHRLLVTRAAPRDRRLLGPLDDFRVALGTSDGQGTSGTGEAVLSPAATRRRRIESEVGALLHALRDQPTVLVVEDIDQLAEPALEALGFLIRELSLEAPVKAFVVATLRPSDGEHESPAAQMIEELREEGFSERVRLPLLDLEAVREMLLSMGIDDRSAAERAMARTAGNPRHIESLVHLEHEHRREKTSLPVDEILRRRVRRSSEEERAVLEALAVLDRPATLPLLADLLANRLRPRLYATVLRLIERRLVTPCSGTSFALFARDAAMVIAARIPSRRLKQLHRLAGRALEVAEVEHEAFALAHHFDLGGVRPAFVRHGLRAARELESSHANGDALSLYRRLLLAVGRGDLDLKAVLLERCGALSALVSDLDGAIEAYRSLLAMPSSVTRQTWHVWKALGRAYRDKDDHVAAAGCFDRGLQALGEGEDLAVADLLSEKAVILARLGDHDTARGLADMAGAMADRLPESRDVAEIQNRIGATFSNLLGDHEGGVAKIEASLRIAERVGALDLASSALNNLGIDLCAHGDRLRGIEHILRGLEICERLGDAQGIAIRAANLGAQYLRNCDLDTAEKFLDRALRIARRFGRNLVVTICLANLAELNFQRARYGEAIETRLRVLKMNERLGRMQDYATQLVALFRDYVMLGSADKAERTARQLMEMANRRDEPRIGAQAQCGLAGALALRHDYLGARRLLAEAEAVLRDIGADEELVQCLLDRAEVDLGAGHRAEAKGAAEEAVTIAVLRGYHGDRALGLLLLAEACLGRETASAERYLREAEGIAREVEQPELAWRSEYLAGELAMRRGDRAGAARRFAQGREILERIVASIGDAELSYSYIRNRRRVILLRQARETAGDLGVG